jgi:putative endonuclease
MKFITYMGLFEGGYLYTGCTGNLHRRDNERRRKFGDAFKVVYREAFTTRAEALAREKQLKGWSRAKKEALIQGREKKLPGLAMRRNGESL